MLGCARMGLGDSHQRSRVDPVWCPLYGYARERPLLQDLSPVRYGRRYRDNAYACRVIV